MPPTDDELLERVRRGDPLAVPPLIARESDFIQAQVQRYFDPALRSVIETDDLHQDVCLRLLRALPHADFSSIVAFRGWVMQVVRTVAIDAHRYFFKTKKRLRISSLDDTSHLSELLARRGNGIPANDPSPSSVLRRAESRLRLAGLLGQLPPHHQEIVRLAVFENQRLIDIAERTGRKPEAVRKELQRALAGCARLLEQRGKSES